MYESFMPMQQIVMETDSGILLVKFAIPYQELHVQAVERLKIFFMNIFQLFWNLD